MQLLKRRQISDEQRKSIFSQIREFFNHEEQVVFVYLHGSLLAEAGFNDIDLAVYLDRDYLPTEKGLFQYGLALSVRLDTALGNGYESDLQVLNIAPLSFQFGVVTKGELLFSRDEDQRVEFEVRVRDLYFDFLPHAEFYYQKIVFGE